MDGISAYRENNITTQTNGRLVVMLYEGAIKFLRQAIEAIDTEDEAAKGKYIVKAMRIIDELEGYLDVDNGSELDKNLFSLYSFMRRHLFQANLHRDAQRCREVITLLQDINEGWKSLSP